MPEHPYQPKHPHIWQGEGHPMKGGFRCILCRVAWGEFIANGECAVRAAEDSSDA